MADVPALYFAQNVGVEVLAGKDPAGYAALNVGVEPLTGVDPVAYGAENIGDWVTPKVDDTLGPEFAFAPILDSLVPNFGRVGQQVIVHGTGFGDEKTFVRWGQTGTAGGVTGGDAKAGPGTIDSTVAPWTIETWFRSQQQGPYATATALETGELVQLLTAGSAVKYSLELASGKVKIVGPGAENVESSLAYDDGKWHHARAVLNADDDLHLLVDGIPLGSVASSSVAVAKVELAQNYRGDQRATRVMKTDLGTHIFTPDWDPGADAATVAMWRMDDGSGVTLVDFTGNGHDLTISGTDYLWTVWDFNVQVTLSALAQGLSVDDVRNNELRWTVAAASESGPTLIKHTAQHVDQSASKTFTVLPTVPLRGVGFEVRVYDKDSYSTLLAVLENAYEISFSLELSEPGAGSFKLNLNDSKATSANLAHGNLVRVYLDTVERFAFRIEDTRENLVAVGDASAQVVTVSGRGLLSTLDDAIVYPPNWPSSDPVTHEFIGASPGEIMKTLVDAAVARGALSGVTVDFDNSDDSAGATWVSSYVLDYYPGQTLTQVMGQLVGLGADIRMTSQQVLQFYNELGVDRTLGDAPTVFAQGDNLVLHARDGSSSGVKNVILLLRGDILMEQSTPSDFPRREAFIDTRQTDDLGTAQELAVRTLESLSDVNDSFDADVISVQDHSEAFVDWDLGDTVYVETVDAGRVQYRVRAVTVKQTDDGRAAFTCTLGNMRYEYLVRLKRMIDMLTGGTLAGASGGGMVGTATPSFIGLYLNTPLDAKYVTLESHLGLTQERVLTAGSGITLTDGGAGAAVTLAHDTGDFGDVHTNYLEHGDVSEAEGFLRKTGAGAYTAHKSKLDATAAPTVNDDTAAGYSVSSEWIDVTGDHAWTCVDATNGAAVWLQLDAAVHAETHVLATTGPHTGTLPWTDLNKTGSSIADLATRTHASLSDAPADAHHVAFVQADADLLYDILGGLATHEVLDTGVHGAGASTLATAADIGTHAGDDNAHHELVTIHADGAHSVAAQVLQAVLTASGQTGHMSGTMYDKLDGIEAVADVTDATNVDAAGAVMEADFDATTFLYATNDNTPQPKTPEEVMAILSGAAGADFSLNTHKLTGVVDPTADQHAATKKYVDDNEWGATEHTAIGDAAPHHAKFTGAEAITAVEGEATLALSGAVEITGILTVDVINEKTGDAGVTFEGVKALDSFLEFTEIATPANPAANKLRAYPVDVGGVTGWAILDSAGKETVLVARTRRASMTAVVLNGPSGASSVADAIWPDGTTEDLGWACPIPSDWVSGTDITLHVHLMQSDNAAANTVGIFRAFISLLSPGEVFANNVANNQVLNQTFPARNEIISVTRTVPGAVISTTDGLRFYLRRLGGDGSDTVNGRVWATTAGAWIEYTAFF